jgi:serine/threonine protein kinase
MLVAPMKPGALLGAKYRIERLLGSGGMGDVWAAVNEATGRAVAIKLMQSPTPELRTRMLREARAVGTLKHKNIVDIYDVGETEDGDPFLVMERLEGETLTDRLQWVGHLPPATAVEITLSIAAALKAAHAKGIVHRDLKPPNVFLHREADGEGEIVKVLDFGVSRQLQDVRMTTGGPVGSPAYMSPEQATDEGVIGPRSDLWSLGVILFEMLAGRRPFPSGSPYRVLTEVIGGPIPSIAEAVPGLSPAVIDVVQRCLTRDVDARVASAEEVIRLLASAVPVDPGENDPTTKLAQMPRSTPSTTSERSLQTREDSTATTTSGHSTLRPIPMGGPSKATVAMVACAAALVLVTAFAVLLRRAPPTVGQMPPGTDAASNAVDAAAPVTTSPDVGQAGTVPPKGARP